jgi:hypothetical protein
MRPCGVRRRFATLALRKATAVARAPMLGSAVGSDLGGAEARAGPAPGTPGMPCSCTIRHASDPTDPTDSSDGTPSHAPNQRPNPVSTKVEAASRRFVPTPIAASPRSYLHPSLCVGASPFPSLPAQARTAGSVLAREGSTGIPHVSCVPKAARRRFYPRWRICIGHPSPCIGASPFPSLPAQARTAGSGLAREGSTGVPHVSCVPKAARTPLLPSLARLHRHLPPSFFLLPPDY